VTLDLAHLSSEARLLWLEASEARIRFIQEARWISHARAQRVLEELEWRLAHPVCSRMPCLLVYGDSGIGKTMVIEKFTRQNAARTYDAHNGVQKRAILTVQMPPSPDERRFYAKILESLHAPFSPSARLVALETIALRLLRKIELKMLVIDEVHQMLAGTYREQRRALNLLKSLTNELLIPVVAVGTEDALHALQTDPQVASRFDPIRLARWTESEAFRNFLVAFGKLLPLRKASPFGDRDMIRLVLARSDGITARVTRLITRAAAESILDGTECIDVARVDSISKRVLPDAA
jgi:Cdc6-like AAA superfamily ATPase